MYIFSGGLVDISLTIYGLMNFAWLNSRESIIFRWQQRNRSLVQLVHACGSHESFTETIHLLLSVLAFISASSTFPWIPHISNFRNWRFLWSFNFFDIGGHSTIKSMPASSRVISPVPFLLPLFLCSSAIFSLSLSHMPVNLSLVLLLLCYMKG